MPVPKTKSLSRLLFLLFALFIVYGTTIPFSFTLSPSYFAERLHRINWYPLLPGYSNSLFDDVQNVLLFLPFGFLGWIAVRDKTHLWKAVVLVFMGMGLSILVETLQILSATRTPAFTDVVFNTTGTALGLFGAMLLRRSVHGFSHHPEVRALAASEAAYPTLVFAALVLVGQLAPFDFSLDFGFFKNKIKILLAAPFALGVPTDDLIFMGRQMLLTVFLGRLLRQGDLSGRRLSGHRSVLASSDRFRSAMIAALVTAGYGLALEAAQVIVGSRGPTFQDALVLILGSIIGALLVPVQGWRKHPLPAALFAYLCVLTGVAMKELHPFQFGPWQGEPNFVPFLAEYAQTSFLALARFIEDALMWLPLGFCWVYLLPRVRLASLLAVAAALSTSMTLELAQGFVPGRYPDITDLIAAALGTAAGALILTRGRMAFEGYLKNPYPG